MHRSGTSAVAGTAVRLGLAPPLTPLPASDDNPSGFYESFPVVQLNHQMLVAAGCAWNLCLTFEPDRLGGLLQEGDRLIIAETLRREFAGAAGFVLKDPRLCLTLQAWLPTLRAAGDEVCVLLVVRHPQEVAHSLARRNQLSEVETIPNWLHHILEAERLSRGSKRAVVFYDDLLTDWRRCMAEASRTAHIAWPRPITGTERDIDGFVAGSSRHHMVRQTTAVIGPPPVCDMVNAAWISLRRLWDTPESADALACLDHVRTQFAIWRGQAYPPGTRVTFPRA